MRTLALRCAPAVAAVACAIGLFGCGPAPDAVTVEGQRALEPIEEPQPTNPDAPDDLGVPEWAADDSPVQERPFGSISWREAKVGEVATVCGPIAGSFQKAPREAVFLNLGFDYPDPRRLTIVAWDFAAAEPAMGYKNVCAHGEVISYEGARQIHVNSPATVQGYGEQ